MRQDLLSDKWEFFKVVQRQDFGRPTSLDEVGNGHGDQPSGDDRGTPDTEHGGVAEIHHIRHGHGGDDNESFLSFNEEIVGLCMTSKVLIAVNDRKIAFCIDNVLSNNHTQHNDGGRATKTTSSDDHRSIFPCLPDHAYCSVARAEEFTSETKRE